MTSPARSSAGDATAAFVSWLVTGAVGPALVALPVNLAADKLSSAAVGWFKRLRQTDDLSRLVKAASGTSVHLSRDEVSNLRSLLTREQTWRMLAGGKLNERLRELTAQIVGCLPPRDGRTVEDAREAAAAIARGLLEFAVYDLQPDIFQKVVLVRLQQMTDQASALDTALVRMHGDLYHLAGEVKDLFRQVMDRLPLGPAGLSEIRIYLKTLISWLNNDPWPRDQRLGGPVLTPAAIERKLRVSGTGSAHEQDADELVRQCTRLVILGGPGSGKTWLAKRTARLCAEAALDAMAEGAGVNEVELPLYLPCARLAAVPPGDGIRRAVVVGALGLLPDLGGTRIMDSLQVLFEERNAPTLLVADSLDEARAADDRVRQADTLSSHWRIMLTTRPGSWNRQLVVGVNDPARCVGILQPLRYPEDVELIITTWFAGHPDQGEELAAQLRARPELQQAAAVPLILAFYCIISGGQPLPVRRSDVYARVIRRMLTGRWRGVSGTDIDPDACLEILRDWAWSAAASMPVSGVGAWQDEFPALRVRLSKNDRKALDHVAVPLGPPDIDTGMTPRRYVHRSIHEHLVAEHVARMPAEEAAAELLNHLWYDPDWEYAAPAALAPHPLRDQVLGKLISRITGGSRSPADLAAADACWEVRRFLARVALESAEGDWSPQSAELIGRARLSLTASKLDPATSRSSLRDDPNLGMAPGWPTSNRLILDLLIGQLKGKGSLQYAWELARAVTRVYPRAEDRAHARTALLARAAGEARPMVAVEVTEAVANLDPTAEERAALRDKLLTLFDSGTGPLVPIFLADAIAQLADATAQLAVTGTERAQTREALATKLSVQADPWIAVNLAEKITGLDPTAEERAHARAALLTLLTAEDTLPEPDPSTWGDVAQAISWAEALDRLGPSAEERARARKALLALLSAGAVPIAEAVIRLDPTAEERDRIREELLTRLSIEKDRQSVAALAAVLARIAATPEEKTQARRSLLTRIADETSLWTTQAIAEQAVGPLDPTADDQERIRESLLVLLACKTRLGLVPEAANELALTAGERDRIRAELLARLAATTNQDPVADLVTVVTSLEATPQQRRRIREKLLSLLANAPERAGELSKMVASLEPTVEEMAQLRNVLLGLLAVERDPHTIGDLVNAITPLDPTAEELAQPREFLFTLLAAETAPWFVPEWFVMPDSRIVNSLTWTIAELELTAEERMAAREALFTHLPWACLTDPWAVGDLADTVARLAVTAEEQAQSRRTLLRLLYGQTDPNTATSLTRAVVKLNPTAEERAGIRVMLLDLLAGNTGAAMARFVAQEIAWLDPTPDERARLQEVLLTLLAIVTERALPDPDLAQDLAGTVAWLDPTPDQRAQARRALFTLLAAEARPQAAGDIARLITDLAVTAEERELVRNGLLARLATAADPGMALSLTGVIAQLAQTSHERERIREGLTTRRASETLPATAREMEMTIIGLSPTVSELGRSHTWPVPPSPELLATARRNSELDAWLAALPVLSR